MRRGSKTKHIIQMFKGPKSGYVICTRCGGSYHLNKMLPADINTVLAAMKSFIKTHRNCKENPNVIRDWEVVQDNG